MTDPDRGGRSADTPGEGDAAIQELDAVWGQLEEDLAGYLSTMVDPDQVDHLLIELPVPDTAGEEWCAPYAQFASFDEGRMIRAEVTGNAYLLPQYQLDQDGCDFFTVAGWAGNDGGEDEPNWYVECPPSDAEEIAHQVVWALRVHFGVVHPHLLTYQAWGPAAGGAAMLGLCATGDVPTDEPAAPDGPGAGRGGRRILDRLALEPDDRDDLLRAVASVLREKYDDEPVVDDDGDFVLEHMGHLVWVCVRTDQPAVEIMTLVGHGVRSRRASAVEIGLLNRDNVWVRWSLRDRTIWQTLALPGMPFVPRHLDAMLDLFLDALTATRDDLALRTGAKVA